MIETTTGFTIHPSNWSQSKQKAKSSNPFLKILNNDLSILKNHIVNATNTAQGKGVYVNKSWLEEEINNCFNRVTKNDQSIILNHIEYYIQTSNTRKGSSGDLGLNPSTVKRWTYFKSVFQEYQEYKNINLTFEMIDKSFSHSFIDWLVKDKLYSKNSAGKFVSQLKTVCKDALGHGIKVNPYFNQIQSFTIQENERHINIIDLEEIEKIKSLKLDNKKLENVRKWILLGLSIGQRVSDLLEITNSNIRLSKEGCLYVDVKQKKTKKDITAPVIDKYIIDLIYPELPYKISQQKFNLYMKKVCELSGIDKVCLGYMRNKETNRNELVKLPKHSLLSSHDLRRSFATNYFGKVSTPILMQITGHSRESTFLHYIGKSQNKDSYADAFINALK